MDNMKQQAEIMVSVCCLCYNQKDTVARMMDSIVSQKTSFPFEVVIHDDASTDGTREIIEEYAGRYPEIIVPILQDENQYSKGVRPDLFVISQIKGKYAAFCEGDDYWYDEAKLQRQVDGLEKYPSCSFSVHNVKKKNARDGKDLGKFPPVPIPEGCMKAEEYIKQELGNDNWMFQTSAVMVRRDILKEYYSEFENGFMSKFMVGDLPLVLYALSKGDAYYINRDMSVYSVESGGFMSSIRKNRKLAMRVHQSYIDGIEEYDRFTDKKFHEYTEKAILRRRFELLVLKRDFKTLLSDPYYEEALKERGRIKKGMYRLFAVVPLIPAVIDRIRGK